MAIRCSAVKFGNLRATASTFILFARMEDRNSGKRTSAVKTIASDRQIRPIRGQRECMNSPGSLALDEMAQKRKSQQIDTAGEFQTGARFLLRNSPVTVKNGETSGDVR